MPMTGMETASKKSGAPYQNTYAYDCMNRLLEAVQDGKPEKYTYDLAGNRLKKSPGRKRKFMSTTQRTS